MCTVFDEVEGEPVFLGGLVHMLETYGQMKLDFLGAAVL